MENESNVAVIEDESVNQIKAPIIDEIVLTAFNRKQRRKFDAINRNRPENKKIPFKLHVTAQHTNKNASEFKQSKKELALQFGSKTGKLKKKHLNRSLQAEGLRG
jgi:hypothetical protein